MKLLLIIAIIFSSCTVQKKATLIGYDKDRMILVSTDTVSYGSKNKGVIGDQYKVKFRGNKVVSVQTVKK